MAQKRVKPGPLVTAVTGSGRKSLAASDRNNTANLAEIQSAFIATRFELTPAVAATVASLAWGGAHA